MPKTNKQESAPLSIEIGRALARARKSRSMTQAELAEAIGVNDSTISYYESARLNLKVPHLLRMCQVMCVTPGSILDDLVDTSEE